MPCSLTERQARKLFGDIINYQKSLLYTLPGALPTCIAVAVKQCYVSSSQQPLPNSSPKGAMKCEIIKWHWPWADSYSPKTQCRNDLYDSCCKEKLCLLWGCTVLQVSYTYINIYICFFYVHLCCFVLSTSSTAILRLSVEMICVHWRSLVAWSSPEHNIFLLLGKLVWSHRAGSPGKCLLGQTTHMDGLYEQEELRRCSRTLISRNIMT